VHPNKKHLDISLPQSVPPLTALLCPTPAANTHGLSLLVENGLGLTSVSGLLSVISPLSLGHQRVFTLLVLGDLVRLVLPALLALAVGPSGLGTMDTDGMKRATWVSLGFREVFRSGGRDAEEAGRRGGRLTR
jgi:hypothetical protein